MSPDFIFNKGKARQALALGDLERAVLEILWDTGGMSGKAVFDKLGKKHKVRHNTLLTVLDRLVGKGLVNKAREGRTNFYKPILNRDEFARQVASPIIDELFDVSSHAAMSALVDSAGRDPEKLDALKKLIIEAEKKQSRKNKENKES